ncbi:mitochondrial chaperone BCS1 [Ephemerocybe angulata]|uniref:Mitochondrial chaperone BCS1 n=1 Tax=Ephemerocybe angulata TaxID=980116 RepID=A0A8H6LZZ8_9AGAR|nr:mitochondrial chaperone BCS1 [Tulosesus angulatus]
MDAGLSTPTGWASLFSNTLSRIMGFSIFASIFNGGWASGSPSASGGYVFDSARLLILGTVLEAGRRFFQWLVERFRLQYSITAQFTEGDPAFEWIVMYMTEKNIWKRSRDFRINAKSSIRRWGIRVGADSGETDNKSKLGDGKKDASEHVDLVPTYELPHLFKWRRVWIETKRSTSVVNGQTPFGLGFSPGVIYLTMYTLDINALQEFIEEARVCYVEHGRASVILHTASQPNFGPGFVWNCVKRKLRRPISSIILEDGMIESIVADAREFIEMENWYIDAGIPHRRGYLLHGPPGTGKTSTIHALAGELGLEIFSLSLSAGFVDDAFLQQAASSIPKKAILLIEDIDCAFSTTPRLGSGGFGLDADSGFGQALGTGFVGGGGGASGGGASAGMLAMPGLRRSSVTLSGLLNVIDGIGSEEGILFFATTNCIERLDPALLRPGRIDRKIQYRLTTKAQAASLFSRFFPAAHVTLRREDLGDEKLALEDWNTGSRQEVDCTKEVKEARLAALGKEFADNIPNYEFSTAELQGFLLSCKREPGNAARGAKLWVDQERHDRREKAMMMRRMRDGEAGSFQGASGLQDVGDPLASVGASVEASDLIPLTPPHTPSLGLKEGIQCRGLEGAIQ